MEDMDLNNVLNSNVVLSFSFLHLQCAIYYFIILRFQVKLQDVCPCVVSLYSACYCVASKYSLE